MGTVIQSKPQSNDDHPPTLGSNPTCDLFDQYRALQAQGRSLRQAAKALEVPRSTLQAWRAYQERLDEHPPSSPFFIVPRGLPSCIAWLSRSIWCVPKWGPVAFAWCVYCSNSPALIALSRPPMAPSNRSTVRWRRRS